MREQYQVGSPNNPKPDDAKFGTFDDAYAAASKIAGDTFSDAVAIWDERCDIVHLFLNGQEFKPA